MTYCSDLTRQRIIECAKKEFLKRGFIKAQVVEIAKSAKITTGAIYRHFKDKEDLFLSLVREVYDYTMTTLEYVEAYEPDAMSVMLSEASVKDSFCETMKYVDYMYSHFEEFQLLLKCSQGSCMEDFIEEITKRYSKKNSDFIEALYKEKIIDKKPDDLEIHIITKSFITALCECVLQNIPYDNVKSYIWDIVTFHHYGWYGVLGLQNP